MSNRTPNPTLHYSVVIPVYRSARMLPELADRLQRELGAWGGGYEIVFVEDAGGDDSWEVIQALARQHPEVRGLQLARNFGQHNALLCGIRAARGDVIITMDDDLQHPPEVLRALVDHFQQGFDVVYGPPVRQRHGLLRDCASFLIKLALQSVMGARSARSVSALRVFRTSLRESFSQYDNPIVDIDVLLTWGTKKFSALSVEHQPRKEGRSGYTFRKLLKHAFDLITGYSVRPLQFASVVGVVFFLFGVVVLLDVIYNWMRQGSVVPGFAFLASIIAVFSGAQLLALGIMGEYIARMHMRSLGKPSYVLGQSTQIGPITNLNSSPD